MNENHGGTDPQSDDAMTRHESAHASPDLGDHVIVVTGATGALGRSTVHLLARHGARVAALGRDERRLTRLARHDGVHPWAADLRDEDRLRRVAEEIDDRLGPPTALVTFAGGNGLPVPTEQETMSHWQEVIEDDLTTTFRTVHVFLPRLLTHRHSAIVTMASTVGLRAGRSSAAYAAAKAGVVGLTRHLALELAPHGVRVNCLAPSAVENDRLAALPPDRRAAMERGLPLGRMGHPEDVAHAALHLVGPHAGYTSGAVLELGGPPR